MRQSETDLGMAFILVSYSYSYVARALGKVLGAFFIAVCLEASFSFLATRGLFLNTPNSARARAVVEVTREAANLGKNYASKP